MKTHDRVKQIKQQLLRLGPLLPGSLSEQWNVCGSLGCRCKDALHPQKHGPYYQLSFSVGGRSSSLFVRREDVAEARRRIQRYQQFKRLSREWVKASVEGVRSEGFRRGRHDR